MKPLNPSMHILEDLAKPENRVNWALLSILSFPGIKKLLCTEFKLPESSILAPSPNLAVEDFVTTQRPDIKVVSTLHGDPIAYIEVELGSENKEQVRRYQQDSKLPVYSIVGKESDVELCECPAISLERISAEARVVQRSYSGTQESVPLELFCSLVEHYVINGGWSGSSKRAPLSAAMKASAIIRFFYDTFGSDAIVYGGKCEQGKLLIDTVGENGFSIRVYSRQSTSKSFSLMARSAGRNEIIFPSMVKLVKYFPYKATRVEAYVELIERLGAHDIRHAGETERLSLPLAVVEANLPAFAECIKNLV